MANLHRLRVRAPSSPQRLRLLVVEQGASPMRRDGSDEFDETLVVAQLPAESPTAFAQRILQRLALAERAGRHFEAALLLTGGHHDPATSAARRLLALGLAAHGTSRANPCALQLEALPSAGQQARATLLALVEEVASVTERGAAPVRLRFGQASPTTAEPTSGIFWSVPASRS